MQVLLVGIGAIAFSVVVQSTAAAAGVAIVEAMIRRGRALVPFGILPLSFKL